MAEAGSRRYPQQLTSHLRDLSKEKNNELQLYREWTFCHIKDSGETDRRCPCGKTGIRYLCYIKNRITGMLTFVGTKCVEFFDEEMKEVLKLSLGLISTGVTGKYKGLQKNGKKKRFEVRANSKIVKKEPRLKALFKHVPIYQKRNKKWEIQAFTQRDDLTLDECYTMKIKSSRWTQDYGNGITFRVTELERIQSLNNYYEIEF